MKARVISRVVRASIAPLSVLAMAIIAAEILVRALHIKQWLLPPPSAILDAAIQRRGDLAAALFSTSRAALTGFALSAIVGIAAAAAMAGSRWLRRALYPYTVFFQTVPIVAVAPLLVIWFGFGFKSVVVSAFVVSVFPVIANTLTGLLSTDPALRDLFRLYGAGSAQTLVKLTLPSALPNIITGLRISAGLAVIGAVVGEFVAGVLEGDAGLGVMVLESKRVGDTALVFAAVLASSMLGLAMFAMINLAGYLLLRRWHASEQ